jgi:transposase
VDAYGVDGGVYLGSARRRASCCIAHARRKFNEAKSSHPRLAAEALGFFQQLYDIEDRARELSDEARQALRQAEAAPLLQKLRLWAEEQAAHALPKLKFGEALGYLRNQWDELTNYIQNGRLPIDNNAVERDLRALTIGRKNWLFIGSQEAGPRAAMLYTVVASAARHDLDVWAYLRDVLERLAIGDADPASLLPDVWARAHPEAIRTYRAHEREAVAAAQRARRARRRALERAQARRR